MRRRWCGWRGAVLGMALVLGVAGGGEATSRLASENPYKGVTELLRFDTVGLLVWPDSKDNRTIDFVSPDANEVLAGTQEIARQGNVQVGAGYSEGVRGAVLLHDGSNRPAVFEAIHNPDKWQDPTMVLMATPVATGAPGSSGRIPVAVGTPWVQSVNCSPATMFRGLTVNRADWDQDGADDVVVLFFDGDDHLNFLGVGNAAGSPKVGKPQRLALDVAHLMLGSSVNSHPLRSTLADLDGDGVPEIALVYENIVLSSNAIKYRLLIFRVVPDAKMAGDWKYAVQCIADQKLDSAGSSGTHSPMHALDIAAGDFDTDGKDEIFFIGRTSPGLRWYTFEMTGGALVQIRSDGFVPGAEGYMARAAVGDLDGDGTPEAAVFFARNDNSLMLTWGKVAPGNTFTQALQIGPPSGTDCVAMDLAAANLTGSVVPKAYRSNAAHLVSSWALRSGPTTVALHRYDDTTKGLRATSRHTSPVALAGAPAAQRILKLLPGDYTNAGLRLGAPVHIVVEDQITPLVIMQEPPKHLDHTLVDAGKYGVLNLTRYVDFYTNFFKSQTSSQGVSSSQRAESVSALSMSFDASIGYKCKAPFMKSDTTAKFEGSLKDTTAKTDESLNESYASSTSSIKAATNADDYVAYRCRTVDIWRYPVLGQKGLRGGEQVWLSVSVPTPQTVMNFAGMQVPWFQPPWSNGNLLSYPSDRTQLDDYAEIAKLGEGQDFLISRNKTSWEVGWTQETKKEKTHTETVTHQSDTSFSISEEFKVFGVHGSEGVSYRTATDDSSEKSSTETNAFSTETGFSMESSGTFPAINNSNAYVVSPFVYTSPAGVLKVAYTARIPQGNLAWWYARYAQAPDVALNLPCVWTMKEENAWEWDESAVNNPNARRIRGFFIYDASGDMEGDAISTTRPVLLRCRVHNFSMAAPNNADPTARNVAVRFEVAPYTPSTQTEGPRKLIGQTSVPAIVPWGGSGRNWSFADLRWDVTQVPDGHYRIHVTVNPDKAFSEIAHHGLGETNDNNQGWYEVFVSKPQNTALAVRDGRVAAEGTGNITGTVRIVRSGDRDLRIHGVGHNNGSKAMQNIVVTLYEGSKASGDAFAQAYIPGILPGGNYPFTLTHRLADPQAGAITALIHYKLEEGDWTDNVITARIAPAGSESGGCAVGSLPWVGALVLLLPLGVLRRR